MANPQDTVPAPRSSDGHHEIPGQKPGAGDNRLQAQANNIRFSSKSKNADVASPLTTLKFDDHVAQAATQDDNFLAGTCIIFARSMKAADAGVDWAKSHPTDKDAKAVLQTTKDARMHYVQFLLKNSMLTEAQVYLEKINADTPDLAENDPNYKKASDQYAKRTIFGFDLSDQEQSIVDAMGVNSRNFPNAEKNIQDLLPKLQGLVDGMRMAESDIPVELKRIAKERATATDAERQRLDKEASNLDLIQSEIKVQKPKYAAELAVTKYHAALVFKDVQDLGREHAYLTAAKLDDPNIVAKVNALALRENPTVKNYYDGLLTESQVPGWWKRNWKTVVDTGIFVGAALVTAWTLGASSEITLPMMAATWGGTIFWGGATYASAKSYFEGPQNVTWDDYYHGMFTAETGELIGVAGPVLDGLGTAASESGNALIRGIGKSLQYGSRVIGPSKTTAKSTSLARTSLTVVRNSALTATAGTSGWMAYEVHDGYSFADAARRAPAHFGEIFAVSAAVQTMKVPMVKELPKMIGEKYVVSSSAAAAGAKHLYKFGTGSESASEAGTNFLGDFASYTGDFAFFKHGQTSVVEGIAKGKPVRFMGFFSQPITSPSLAVMGGLGDTIGFRTATEMLGGVEDKIGPRIDLGFIEYRPTNVPLDWNRPNERRLIEENAADQVTLNYMNDDSQPPK